MRWMKVMSLLVLLVMATSAAAAEKKLPSFTLSDLDGKRHKGRELLDNAPALFNFWATWCKPCLAEQPKLKEFHEQWAESGFKVISVSVDDPRTQKQVRPFARRHKIEFPIYLDPNQEAIQRLGGRAVPFNVLVGHDGTILSVSMGYKDADAEHWAELIAQDLAQRGEQAEPELEAGEDKSD